MANSFQLDKTVTLWDAAGKKLQTPGHTDYVVGVAMSDDGKHVVTGSHDRTAILWRTVDKNSDVVSGSDSGIVKLRADGCPTIAGSAHVEKFGRLLVRLGRPGQPSGQMYFDFGDDVLILEPRPTTAEDWFQLGCQHESVPAMKQSTLIEHAQGGCRHRFNLANVLCGARKQEASGGIARQLNWIQGTRRGTTRRCSWRVRAQ
jgi:hypothetical protein